MLPAWVWVAIPLAIAVVGITWVWLVVCRRATRRAARPAAAVAMHRDGTLSIEEIERSYAQRKATYEARCRAITERLGQLQQRTWEHVGPIAVLGRALPQELGGLRAIVKVDDSASIDDVVTTIHRAGSNATASIGRKAMGRDSYVPYHEALEDAAKKLKLRHLTPDMSDADIEKVLIATAFKATWDKATSPEREALLTHLSASDRKALCGMGATGTALAGASATGFPLYVAASTALGSLTSAIGVTLPFAAYTTMSSSIAFVIGPAGWLALLGLAAWKIGGVNYAITVPAVIAVAAIRGRLIAERDQEITGLEAEQRGALASTARHLAEIEGLLGRMRAEGLRCVARESVPV